MIEEGTGTVQESLWRLHLEIPRNDAMIYTPRMKLLVLAFLTVMGALPLSAADIVPDPFPPAHFSSLYLEKDEKGKITSIQLSGDDIIYKVVVGGREIATATAHPSGDDWFQFVQGLNQAKVYKWAPSYTYPGQGITWVVDFAMENRKMTTGGTNEFPKAGDEGQPQADPQAGPSVPFLILWQAALALAGKAPPPVMVK